MVSLSIASDGLEVASMNTIDENKERHSGDTIHNCRGEPFRKTHIKQS